MGTIDYIAAGEGVRIECEIGSIDLTITEARRCLAYLNAANPRGVIRVHGDSTDVVALWLDRTLDSHLIVHAAPVTTRVLEPVAVMPNEVETACALSRAIVTAIHSRSIAESAD